MKNKNIIVLIVILIILVVVFIPKQKIEYVQKDYIVKQGDTLYSIALKNCSNKDNLQEYIYKLKKINNKNDSIIYVNEKIVILIEK